MQRPKPRSGTPAASSTRPKPRSTAASVRCDLLSSWPGLTHSYPVQLFVFGSCAVCTEFAPKIFPWPGLTRPSTSSDRRNVAKKDVGGRVKPGHGVSMVDCRHHPATGFAEPDSRPPASGGEGKIHCPTQPLRQVPSERENTVEQ